MIIKLFTTLYVYENTFYFVEDSGNVVFNCKGMGIPNIDHNNINLDNNFVIWYSKFEKRKALKKKLNE